jgi:hypothetical protein
VDPPQVRDNDLECPGQCYAQPAEDHREAGCVSSRQRVLQRRPGGQGVQDGPELYLLVDPVALVDRLLQALGDRQVPGLDGVARIGLRGALPDQQEVVDRLVDEVQVALDVLPVDIETPTRKKRSNFVNPMTGMHQRS